MKISEYFNLNKKDEELDFVDIPIDTDLLLFINPRLIHQDDRDLSRRCEHSIRTFFDSLLTAIKNHKDGEAFTILSHTREINEIHLGFSKDKARGAGFGDNAMRDLISSLRNSEAIQTGMIEDIEDISLFAEGVGNDRLSDLTGNVIRKYLVKYTKGQCHLCNIPTEVNVPLGYFWDEENELWTEQRGEGLVIDDKLFLLVPKAYVLRNSFYRADRLLRHNSYLTGLLLNYAISFKDVLKLTKRDNAGNIINEAALIRAFKNSKDDGYTNDKRLLITLLAKDKDGEGLKKIKEETEDTSFFNKK